MKRVISAILALFILYSLCLTASANWYDDCNGGEYKLITSNHFVADTFCGVDAIYDLSSGYYHCGELVIRFYKEAYGLDVALSYKTCITILTKGYDVAVPTIPHPGDVIYTPSEQREGNGQHFALVKSYKDGIITLFEQNVVWQGKAGINRQLKYPSDSYIIYTPVAKDGYPAPVLKNAPADSLTTPEAPDNQESEGTVNPVNPDTQSPNIPDDTATDTNGALDLSVLFTFIQTFFEFATKYLLPIIRKLMNSII
ncbi:MAG: hypothetical protein MJ121_05425 [Clostridia bacterium]|nr:hypothetical protein [Clostridia bacterium]